jgi:8-oxo-dGTP pyrophosphatase MutT (NUDIX family)
MKRFVLGFALSPGYVLLLRKRRPAWQRGHLNGIGGAVKPGELPIHAMRREAEEEAGIVVDNWREFLQMRTSDRSLVRCYTVGLTDAEIMRATAKTDEAISLISRSILYGAHRGDLGLLPNVLWLIEMAQDKELAERRTVLSLDYLDRFEV